MFYCRLCIVCWLLQATKITFSQNFPLSYFRLDVQLHSELRLEGFCGKSVECEMYVSFELHWIQLNSCIHALSSFLTSFEMRREETTSEMGEGRNHQIMKSLKNHEKSPLWNASTEETNFNSFLNTQPNAQLLSVNKRLRFLFAETFRLPPHTNSSLCCCRWVLFIHKNIFQIFTFLKSPKNSTFTIIFLCVMFDQNLR